ncbi:F-box only protein 33-like [Saccoglossus kowalevskii]|uniref:F-box only protein 33-like n=1 Tax=Saccoglossus kowalevskii TaxID=10224 RepID=A0ABM0GM28_SACKO|nr:PREDICTED: F-box only protein 33-like [Saccoglossus kowalevskii]
MAGPNTTDWSRLPSVVIVEIFSFLSHKDRIHASSICSRWRQCIFHPSLWKKLEFNLENDYEYGRANFLSSRCGNFVGDFTLEWPDYLLENKKALAVLQNLRRNRRLQKLCLLACNSDFDDETLGGFIDIIEEILLNSKKLSCLSLGYIPELCDSEVLDRIGDNCSTSLHTLHLASLLPDEAMHNIQPYSLRVFKNLQILSLNYDDLSNDMLSVLTQPDRTKLQHLLILADGLGSHKSAVSNVMWQGLVTHSPNVKVTLTLLSIPLTEILDILRPSLPLHTVRILYSGSIPRSAIDFLGTYNNKTLEAVYLHEQVESDEMPYLLFPDVEGVEDPLVMLAWRCDQLSCLSIIGYEIMDDNLIAIARLRGPKLKKLEVLADYIVDQSTGENVVAEEVVMQISQSLGKSWLPLESVEEPTFPAILKSDLQIFTE